MSENNRWNKERAEKAMEEGKEEFINLNLELGALMVKFGLRALKTAQAGMNEPLNHLQIEEVVGREIEAVIETLSEPTFVDVVTQKTEHYFYEGTSESLE
jgi:hypothetical protein